MDAFLRDFDMYLCKLFDGARHDSSDPFEWGERILSHYEANRCDPCTKVLVFSDALDIPKVLQLYERFRDRCRLAFGVGTNLDQRPRLSAAADRHQDGSAATASWSPSCPIRRAKSMCDDKAYLAYLRQVFGIVQPAEDEARQVGRRRRAGRCRTGPHVTIRRDRVPL